MKMYPSIKERTIALCVNAVLAYVVFVWATRSWLPMGGIESVWLISAISFWFLSLLSAPWFVPPRDAIISAVGALLVLTTIDMSAVEEVRDQLDQMRWIFVGYSVAVAFFAVIALFLHDAGGRSPFGRFAFRLTSIFGRVEILFSAPAVVSIIGAYQASFSVMGWLVLFWILLAVGKPVEKLAAAWRQLGEDSGATKYQPIPTSFALD